MGIVFLAIILVIVLENVIFLQENKICWITVVSCAKDMAIKLYLADLIGSRLVKGSVEA